MASRRRTLLPIGIHLTRDAVQMVQFEQGEGDLRVVSRAAKDLSTPADVVARVKTSGEEASRADLERREAVYGQAREFVRQKIARDGFRGKDAVISLRPDHLVIQHLRMQPMQPEELAAALPYELHGKLPFDPGDAIVRHIVAGTVSENNETRQDVLVLAVERQVVEHEVASMARLGLNIVGVGVEPCAMCYSYAYAATHSEAVQAGPPCLMVVCLGPQTTHVAIVRGQETTFVKGVEQGTDKLVEAVAAAKSISLEAAADRLEMWRAAHTPETLKEAVDTYNGARGCLEFLADEIESCMRYHASLARGARIDRLQFVGPGARDRGLVRVLSAHLGIPCEVGDPIGTATGHGQPDTAEPDAAIAVGLSLFGAN